MKADPASPAAHERAPWPKLHMPVATARIERHAILRRVFGEHAPGIVILQAPAGHGKTMALSQIRLACEDRGLHCAWLNLDESDNDSRRHAAHLSALVDLLAGRRPIADRRGTPRRSRGAPQRADWLVDALVGLDHEIALFVDEFELLSERTVLNFWRDFLARCPSSVRVFIATRTSPELGLARLLVGNRMMWLSAEDLRFSRDEVRAFFDLHRGIDLHPAEVEAIYRRSEGWPAAVQLFRLGLSNPETRRALRDLDQSQPRELAEYLTECVLADQPAEVRHFLLRTALLTRLTAPLCDILTGRSDSQAMLLRLEREGLFVRALDNERRWFRYHPLFASLLLQQLAEVEPGAARALHQAAAQWLHAIDHSDDAVYHAVAARNDALAATILRTWSSRLVATGQMATVERWLDRLPADRVATDRTLCIRRVWALTFLQRPARLARHLQMLDGAGTAGTGPGGEDESAIIRAVSLMCADQVEAARATAAAVPPCAGAIEGFEAFEQAALENLRAYLKLFDGELPAAHAHLTRARAFNRLADAAFTGAYTAGFDGAVLLLEGALAEALACLRAELERQRSLLDPTFVSAAIASCYVWALYEANDLDLLEAVANEYRELLSDTAVPDFFAAGQICLARTHLLRGRAADARLTLEHAEFIAVRKGWPRIATILALEALALPWRAREARPGRAAPHARRASIQALLERHATEDRHWTSPASELCRSTLDILSRAIGRPCPPASGRPLPSCRYRELHERIARGGQAAASGKHVAALRSLHQAIVTANETGLLRPLLDHGPETARRVREIIEAEAPAHPGLAAIAARLFGADTIPARGASAALHYDSFTAREREILGHLSRRLSNKEIARRLLLSENTVKFHLKNVFAKLGVSSRLDAFAALQRLDLQITDR